MPQHNWKLGHEKDKWGIWNSYWKCAECGKALKHLPVNNDVQLPTDECFAARGTKHDWREVDSWGGCYCYCNICGEEVTGTSFARELPQYGCKGPAKSQRPNTPIPAKQSDNKSNLPRVECSKCETPTHLPLSSKEDKSGQESKQKTFLMLVASLVRVGLHVLRLRGK